MAELDPRFQQLINDSGGRVWLVSGVRDRAEQEQMWNEALARYGSEEAARQWVAPPGSSKHEHGVAADLGGDLTWVAQNADRYGLWRPMEWEPWHWEVAGSRDTDPDPDAGSTVPMAEGQTAPTPRDPVARLLTLLGVDASVMFKNRPPSGSQQMGPFDQAMMRGPRQPTRSAVRPPVVERSGDGATANMPDDYDSWVEEVARLKGLTPAEKEAFRQLGLQESGGQNIWQQIEDYNTTVINDPAFGPWQVIGGTFEAYKEPGYNDRFNPIHSGLASINYQRARYGRILNQAGY